MYICGKENEMSSVEQPIETCWIVEGKQTVISTSTGMMMRWDDPSERSTSIGAARQLDKVLTKKSL